MFIYKSDDIKRIDQEAEEKGMPSFTLMETAGRGLFETIRPLLSRSETILVLAGKGNNGGDAIVLARYLQNDNYAVKLVFPLGSPKTDAAQAHLNFYKECGYRVEGIENVTKQMDWMIDGLLGVGSALPLRSELSRLTSWVNKQESKVIAIDVPTGVASDEGTSDTNAIKADYTFSLHGFKPSAFLFPSSYFYGQTCVVDIGLKQSSGWKLLDDQEVKRSFLKREVSSHKGTFGTGLLIAGEDEMPGSAALAAIGALRFGIGKLTVGTTRHASSVIGPLAPEATFSFEEVQQSTFTPFSAIAVGSGRLPSPELEETVSQVLNTDKPVVLDAGALLKKHYPARTAATILTPHPGEFKKMTGYSTADIQANRMELAKTYAIQHQVIVVLKGQYTVIAFPDGTGMINSTGNPSLAKGGSGDTLTGMLLASISMFQDVKQAVASAVYIHGLCADQWVETYGETSLVAHDFAMLLPQVLKNFSE